MSGAALVAAAVERLGLVVATAGVSAVVLARPAARWLSRPWTRATEPATSSERPFLPATTPTTLFRLLTRNDASTALRLICLARAVREAVTLAASACTLDEPSAALLTVSQDATVAALIVHLSVSWVRTIGATSPFAAPATWLAWAALKAGATAVRSEVMSMVAWAAALGEPRATITWRSSASTDRLRPAADAVLTNPAVVLRTEAFT